MTDIEKLISKLVKIGKLKAVEFRKDKLGNNGKKTANESNKKHWQIVLVPEYQDYLGKLKSLYLIFKDHRVRYIKVDILRTIADNKALVTFDDEDLLQELISEDTLQVCLDEEELNSLDTENLYYDPEGMSVIWNDQNVGTIKDFFYNGAHYVYEITMDDGKLVLIPDVEAFVTETDIEKRFIRVVELDQFIDIL